MIEAATGELIGVAALGAEADIDAPSARPGGPRRGPWGRTTAAERAAVLRRFADALDSRAGDTATLVSRENGMPIGLSQHVERGAPAVLLRMYADVIENMPLERSQPSQAGSTIVRREPVGVVGAITPWNFPQALAMFKIAPALAAGCTVVLKPSPETALDAYVFADAAQGGRSARRVCSTSCSATATPARRSSRTRSSTRSPSPDRPRPGRAIGAECGRLIRRCTLELGGKSAAIFLEDGDLETSRRPRQRLLPEQQPDVHDAVADPRRALALRRGRRRAR